MTITPTGVREGDPAALAALCAVRGPSVVAYCRQVAGEAEAGGAAADAFARFRVGVVAAGENTTLNPEALLISATRTSAATRAHVAAQGDCADVPMLLAGRAEKTIAPQELEHLESHLEQCWACRAPVARFKAAERAYRDPPEKTVEPALTEQIVAALAAAVPPPPPPAPPSANAAEPNTRVAAVADLPATQPADVDQPTAHFAAPGMVESETEAGADADGDVPPRRQRAKRRSTGAAALLSRLRPGPSGKGPRERPLRQPPPPPPSDPGAARERPDRSRPRLRLGIVLPIVLILLALLAALYVSGVFGGSDPESSPRVAVPAGASGDPTTTGLDAVPGTANASGDAVEAAKARKRARERGDAPAPRRQATAKTGAPRQASAPAPSSPPPGPAATPPAPPAATANPVPPPAPRRDTRSTPSAPKQIDAGSGATGAEQIPPAADATDVPELAPPAEPATP